MSGSIEPARTLCGCLDKWISDFPGYLGQQSEHPEFIMTIKFFDTNCGIGHIFLIMHPDGMFHVPKYALTPVGQKTRDLTELARYFTKPNPNLKYWVLKREFRNAEWLRAMGWL